MSQKIRRRYWQDIQDLSITQRYISSKRVGDEVRTTFWNQPLFDCDNKRIDYSKSQTNSDRRGSSIWRTKQSIFDYCHVNSLAHNEQTMFLTLTYRDNMSEIKKAKKDLRNFVSKYKSKIGVSLAYIGVIEFQKRGAIHFHIVIFNSPYLYKNNDAKNLPNAQKSDYKFTWEELWGHGFVNIKKVNNKSRDKKYNNHNSGVARYLTKYIVKGIDDPRLKGHQFHIRSRGLLKPYNLYSEIKPENIAGIHQTLASLFNLHDEILPTYTDFESGKWYLEGRDPKDIDASFLKTMSGKKFNLTKFEDGISW